MKIVSVGCSFTSGVGVLANETYTYQLSKLINSDFHNWGEAGHSNQYIFRKTIELLKNWNPNDILIIQWTNPNRDEIVTNEGYLFYPPFSYWCSLSFLYGKDPIPDLQKNYWDKLCSYTFCRKKVGWVLQKTNAGEQGKNALCRN